jgi:hypothetical protein
LTGERSGGFCCGKQGKYGKDVLPLPPLPTELEWLSRQHGISFLSRKLNLLFSFSAMETTGQFPTHLGVQGFLAIQGRVYHRLRPSHPSSGLRWLLYDGWMRPNMPHSAWSTIIPRDWTTAVASALFRVNKFVQDLHFLSTIPVEDCPEAHITLEDHGTAEIAAIMHYDNTSAGERSISI